MMQDNGIHLNLCSVTQSIPYVIICTVIIVQYWLHNVLSNGDFRVINVNLNSEALATY